MIQIERALNPNGVIAANASCPCCWLNNEVKWTVEGKIEWWPKDKGHCPHFMGAYPTKWSVILCFKKGLRTQ